MPCQYLSVSQAHAARLTLTAALHARTVPRRFFFCNTGLDQGQAADEASRRVAHVFADAVQQHASPGSFALVSFDTIRPPPIRIEMREGGDLHY